MIRLLTGLALLLFAAADHGYMVPAAENVFPYRSQKLI
jgi:hypothetical protein